MFKAFIQITASDSEHRTDAYFISGMEPINRGLNTGIFSSIGKKDMNWLKSSMYERRELYIVVKKNMKQRNLTWNDVFLEALGTIHVYSDDFESNMRRGRYSCVKSNKIFEWLYDQDRLLAICLTRRLDPTPSYELEDWEREEVIERFLITYKSAQLIRISDKPYLYKGESITDNPDYYVTERPSGWVVVHNLSDGAYLGVAMRIPQNIIAELSLYGG